MIDLSFLTEEEQEAIMKVLQRDAELKKAEEERVRHLPEKVKDDVQLKNMSGQWFYEAKSKRHRDKIHGADIIRASMRRKPSTVAEASQSKSNKAKNSWVSNVNKEVVVPPELHGIVEHQEEEELKSSSSSKTVTSGLDKPEGRSTKATVSPVKQRRNPFNSTVSGDNLSSGESENRPDILPQLSKKEILSPSIESQPKTNVLSDETETPKKPSVEPTDESQNGLVKRPIPKARKLVHKITDPVPQREDIVPKPAKRTQGVNGTGIPPRGILKRSSSSSSTDSEVRVNQMLDVQSKNSIPTKTIFEGEVEKNTLTEEVEESTQISLEKLKQVRFSSSIGKRESLQSPQIHHSKETGELDLLESGEIKTSENDAVGTDSLGNKQTSTVKPLGTHSSSVHVKTHSLQEDKSASSPCDTNGSVFLVNKTFQTKIVTPKKLETPQKTSTNILSNSNKELSVDETCENKSNQSMSRESKSLKNSTDEHLLSAETKAHEVSNTNSAALQQGKPNLVEERDAKHTFEPDRHADEFVKVADESVSKVLDWFKRSSGTEDRKPVSARSQGRELKEVGFSTGTTVLPTEYSGTSMDGKPEVIEELPSGRDKQLNAISPTTIISEDKQMIKERRRPKQGEENEEQNDKSLTEPDCTRIEDKELGQEIKQQNQKSRVLEHHEHKLPAQKYELEKAIREKRRIREIRAFWERDKTIPSHREKEVGINTNASGGGALKGLRESDKIKPTAEHLPYGLDDQSKNTLRSAELRYAIVASKNECQNSFEFGQGREVRKPERTLPADGEIHEHTKLAKASNIKPRVSATSASPEIKNKDGKETFKGKVGACSQQKPSFQVFSLKEMSEKSKNQISNSSQFQSLRNFWDAGVKLQSSIDRRDVSLPNNTVNNNTSIIHQKKSKEDKGRDNVSKQVLIQHQTQASEREKTEKLDSVICELPLGSLTLKGMKVTHTQNTDSVQPVKKPVISQPQEQMGLHKHEVKGHIEKSIASSKEHPLRGSQKMQAGLQNLLRETSVCQPSELRVGMKASETVNNISQTNCSGESICQQDTSQSEEVNETAERSVAPSKVSALSSALEKLMKEASETPPPKPRRVDRTLQKTAEIQVKSTTYQHDGESLQEISESIEKSVAPPKVSGLSSALEKLQKEASETPPPKPKRVDSTVQRTAEMQVKSTTYQHDGESLQEISESIEKSVAPPKVSGLSSALEKLQKEASETPPPKPKRVDNTVQRTAETQVERTTYQHDGESLQEISESIEKSVAPSKVSGLSSALEKLLKEASETPPPKPKRVDSTVQRTAEMQVKSTTYQHDGESLQEISESIEKSVAPPKVSGLSSALEKLLKEASETPPPKPKRVDNTVQRTAEMQVERTTYQHDGESLQEISESIEKSVAPPKVSGLSSALEKLQKEASETPPPKPKRVDNTLYGTAEMQVKNMTYQHDGESLQEISESIEKSVAPSKVSGLSSALEKLLKEASETPPPKPRRVDNTVQRTAETQVERTTYQHDGESLQEVSESIEKSVAPSKVSGLSSALEKLQKEASETPPPKPKRVDNTLYGTAEMQVKNMTYQHDGESLQEISESIEKSVAPSKVSGLSSALEKLQKEASETPPPKPRRVDNTVQRTAETQVESTTYQHDGESLQEVSESIEKSVAPSKVSGLSSALEKLQKEASETPPPKPKRVDNTLYGTAEMQVKNMTYQHDGESLQEISESIEKSVAPSKVSGLSSALEKLQKEASETPPPKPRRVDNTVQRTAETQVERTTYQHDGESLQEISESIEKSVAPSKVSGLSSALEKLLKEASETPPPKPKRVDRTLQRTAEVQVRSVTYQLNGVSLQEKTGETTEASALSKAEYKLLDVNLQKLLKEVSETPAHMLENMDEKMQGKTSASQSMCRPPREERDHPQEIEETIEKSSVSNIAKFRDFSSSLEKLLQEASEASSPVSREVHKQEKSRDRMFPLQKESLFTTMSQPYHNALTTYHTQMKTTIKSGAPEQNIEASIDIEASDLLKRNGAFNQKEQRNVPPIDLLPLEGETNTAVSKPFKVNDIRRTDESTSSDASENNLELKELLQLRRTSAPLKDESNSPQPGGARLCLAFQHEDNDEDDGDSSNLGSRFSDENSDSCSGTGSSTRSEELNPVLMALKRSADRKMPSKSLEDIPSATSNKGKINIPKEELALSAEDAGLKTDQDQERNENAAGISTVPPQPDKLFSNPEKLKGLSKSVPSFLQEEVSGSLMSVYSGDFGNVDVKGNIQFAIDYVEQLNELHIFICQCKDLAVADVKRQRSDPYVKTYLLPEKYKLGKRKTSVKKKTFNPVYNEILRYKIEKDLLKNQSLNISVWHNDTFGRNSFLGEVELDLGTWDWNDKSNKQINWFPLKPRTSTMALELENRGEMKLALKYVPQPAGGKKTLSTGEVHIWVKECHDLPLLRGNRLNSFIKCTILPDTSRKSRQKTRTVAKTTNPVFNHTMVYDGFRPEDLKEACIELTVWDHNKLANHFLGGLRIGLGTGRSYGTTVDWMDSTSDESALWEKMMNLPNTWVEDTLPLRMLMVAKLTK
ncbi:synaptotagmin-like protein 2 isoform X4 [Cygnus olor]|uniref:synaptotagmin-like protein 2 isoform X4 n=1 Tax=Cygnus olor TaxID=8869 RepID=UPI001ADE2E2F|nr:synaptotagmin-like protein 2 isoform X4 [Cygnus olor]